MSIRQELNLRYHWSSEIYGQGKAFRKLLHFPRWMPLIFTSDHAAAVGSDVDVRCLKLKSLIRLHTTWSQEIRDTIISLQIPRVFPSVMLHPWVQYKNLMRINRDSNPSGSIFFPHHSSGGATISGYDDLNCLEFLKSLPEKYHPITICFYHPDLATSRPEAFQTSGYRVTSAGDTRDYDFIDNFYDLISKFKFAFSEGWGSQVSYCVDLGIPTMVIPRDISFDYQEGSSVYFGSEDLLLVRDLQRANKIFGHLPNSITLNQSDFVRNTLGYGHAELKGKNTCIIWALTLINFPIWVLVTTYNVLRILRKQYFSVKRPLIGSN